MFQNIIKYDKIEFGAPEIQSVMKIIVIYPVKPFFGGDRCRGRLTPSHFAVEILLQEFAKASGRASYVQYPTNTIGNICQHILPLVRIIARRLLAIQCGVETHGLLQVYTNGKEL